VYKEKIKRRGAFGQFSLNCVCGNKIRGSSLSSLFTTFCNVLSTGRIYAFLSCLVLLVFENGHSQRFNAKKFLSNAR